MKNLMKQFLDKLFLIDKLFIINRATDKILNIIEEIIDKKLVFKNNHIKLFRKKIKIKKFF